MRDCQAVFLVVDIFTRIQEKLKDMGDQHENVQLFVSQSYSMSVLVNQAQTTPGLVVQSCSQSRGNSTWNGGVALFKCVSITAKAGIDNEKEMNHSNSIKTVGRNHL